MPWDLAISNLDDLVFSPSRDWMTVTGIDLLHQRILLRLKMKRGSWIFDETKELGSNLDLALRMNQPDAIAEIDSLIAEALDPISDEIEITNVEVVPTPRNERSVDVVISYQRLNLNDAGALESPSLSLTIPIIT